MKTFYAALITMALMAPAWGSELSDLLDEVAARNSASTEAVKEKRRIALEDCWEDLVLKTKNDTAAKLAQRICRARINRKYPYPK